MIKKKIVFCWRMDFSNGAKRLYCHLKQNFIIGEIIITVLDSLNILCITALYSQASIIKTNMS